MRIHQPQLATLGDRSQTARAAIIADTPTRWWEYAPRSGAQEHAVAPLVVAVHGFRGTHHGLLPIVAALPDARCVVPDLPGFGESGRLAVHDLDGYARWLAAFLAAVDPGGRATVLAHSFGTLIVARDVRAVAPRAIVLVNPIARRVLAGPSRVATALGVLYYRLAARLGPRAGRALLANPAITRVMSEVMATTRDGDLRSWIHAEHAAHFSEFADVTSILEGFRASISDDVAAHADRFPPGVVLVAGERDRIAPPEGARELLDRLPAPARLFALGGVGHLTHYEAPIAVGRIVSNLVERPTAGGDAVAAERRVPCA